MSFIFLILFSFLSYGQTKIAIIDTGYDRDIALSESKTPLKLCKEGHFDFLTKKSVVASTLLHGTIVGTIIAKQLRNVDYCALIYQVSSSEKTAIISTTSISKSVDLAVSQGATLINISIASEGFSLQEYLSLKAASDKGVKIFVAAGNNKHVFTENDCKVFPACYQIPNLTTVAALDHTGKFCYLSNRGYKTTTSVGEMTWKLRDSQGYEQRVRWCATSFASPRALSAYVLRHQLRPKTNPKKPFPMPHKPFMHMRDGTK